MVGGGSKTTEELLEHISERILIVDKEQKIRGASWGTKWDKVLDFFIGRKIEELIEHKILLRPATLAVKCLDSGRSESTLYAEENGERYLITGIPLLEKGAIVAVIVIEKTISPFIVLAKELVSEEQKSKPGSKEKAGKSLIYQSKVMCELVDLANRVAKQDVTVLIQGESGTGKEVIANLIHSSSSRSEHSFVKINCGAIPENLLESELFGYEPGAFTGADVKGKCGLFEAADGGTLFLDEIGTMPLHLQVKLLRAIQEKEIIRIGGADYIPVDIRIIAATNADLKKEVERGSFREDLYYRLNVVPITLPPLRDRKADIKPLTDYFMNKFNKKYYIEKQMDESAWKLLHKYSWPGNIRELENVMERLVVTTKSKTIHGGDIERIFSDFQVEGTFEQKIGTDLKDRVENFEKKLILSQMSYYSRSQELADALGIDKSTLTRKMKKYRIKNIYIEKKGNREQ